MPSVISSLKSPNFKSRRSHIIHKTIYSTAKVTVWNQFQAKDLILPQDHQICAYMVIYHVTWNIAWRGNKCLWKTHNFIAVFRLASFPGDRFLKKIGLKILFKSMSLNLLKITKQKLAAGIGGSEIPCHANSYYYASLGYQLEQSFKICTKNNTFK